MKIHRLVVGDLQTNCYLWADEVTGNTIVVDAPDCADMIIDAARKHDLRITDIILTHGHFDHMLGVYDLKQKTGAKLSVFEKTPDFINNNELNLCQHSAKPYIPAEHDVLLCDGDVIDFYGNKISVIHTPGHTADSICLLYDNVLISGDTLFNMSVGRTDFLTGNMSELIASIMQKLMILPDDTKVYPGHGFSTTIGKERQGNPYLI